MPGTGPVIAGFGNIFRESNDQNLLLLRTGLNPVVGHQLPPLLLGGVTPKPPGTGARSRRDDWISVAPTLRCAAIQTVLFALALLVVGGVIGV